MSDEGFHEIQLNGKQLIFLCMTAALVLVVAFLSGVLVGRGVRSQKDASAVNETTASASPAGGEAAAPGAGAPQATPAPPITAIAPPTPADEDLSYNKRLEGKEPPKETVKPQSEPAPPPAAKPAAKGQPVSEATKPATVAKEAPPPDASKAKADTSIPAEPAGGGYYLKVVAYRERGQADGLARRLGTKGYSAYVVPASGLYSVRVGKYKSRKEADTVRRRLEKEEQLKPLIAH